MKEVTINDLQKEIKETKSEEKKQIAYNTTSKWKMTSSAEKRNKGKALIQGYPQDKRLLEQSFVMHDGEVLSKELQFNDGAYTDLPYSIKTILDNLHSAYTVKHHGLFQRTLKALEIHLVNLEARNEAITSLLSGKKEIRSKDKTVKMGTDYARLSLKTQASLRSAVANLPTEIQVSILGSKVMFESIDQWFQQFKILVTTPYPGPDNSDDTRDIFVQATWEEYFGCSLRVYEKEHPFPSLLINYEDGPDEENEMGPYWLSRMFEYGFIKEFKLTSHNQVSQFLQIIKKTVEQVASPFVSIRCWSTIPQWERDNWMTVQPSKHLVLINGYSYHGPWFEGDSHLSYRDPQALTDCWRNHANNEILDIIRDLWSNYHLIGNTGRISVFTTRPYLTAIPNLQRQGNHNPRKFIKRKPEYEPLVYCGFVISILPLESIIVTTIPRGILMDIHPMVQILISPAQPDQRFANPKIDPAISHKFKIYSSKSEDYCSSHKHNDSEVLFAFGGKGKQLDRIEDKKENKVVLQSGNPGKPIQTLEKPLVKLPITSHTSLRSKDVTALEIVTQKLEELIMKEPVTPSPSKATQLNVLDIHTTSSSSSRTSSENEKEIEHIENQFRGLEVKRLHHPTSSSLTKNWYPRPTPSDL
ncbi:hypothetical protein SO802_015291 [Lithocarpus litseifolius]|uniref:Uncharacterized protein n=1 Tax=Lithocarpus litseifolius TaxID=425828 RepID=A0AAW2CXE9_9ROSI